MGMPIFQKPLTDAQGNLKPYATLTVIKESGGVQALYSDRDGAEVVAADGVYTATSGITSFYLPPNLYKMVLAAGGLTQTWRYIHIPPLGEIITDATTSRTSTLKDLGNWIVYTNGSASTYEIDDDVFEVGQFVNLRQAGAGAVTVVEGTGVTVEPPSGGTLVTNGQGASLSVVKRASGTYMAVGHTVAA